MRVLLLLLFTVLQLSTVCIGQTVDSLWNGYLTPFVQTGGTAPNFTFQGAFQSVAGFNGAQVSLSLSPRLVVVSNNVCYELPLTAISQAGSIIAGGVTDPSGQLSALPAGTAAIFYRTSGVGAPPHITGISPALQSCIQTAANLLIEPGTLTRTLVHANATGSTLTLPSGYTVSNQAKWQLIRDGLMLYPGDGYTVSGSTVTLTTAAAGERFWILDLR